MRLPTALLLLPPLFTTLTAASITGIALPSTLAPSSTIPITLITTNFIQTVSDIAIAFGLSPTPALPLNESLGITFLGSKYLGPDESNIATNITLTLTTPAGLQKGPAVFNGVLYSLLGADSLSVLQGFSVNVTVGEEVGGGLVRSGGPVQVGG
ncbi:hypothetical protein ACLMJK_004702 [Lecanora helva]